MCLSTKVAYVRYFGGLGESRHMKYRNNYNNNNNNGDKSVSWLFNYCKIVVIIIIVL